MKNSTANLIDEIFVDPEIKYSCRCRFSHPSSFDYNREEKDNKANTSKKSYHVKNMKSGGEVDIKSINVKITP